MDNFFIILHKYMMANNYMDRDYKIIQVHTYKKQIILLNSLYPKVLISLKVVNFLFL